MAVSKLVLGMNARNYLFIGRHNRRRAKELADDKLATKEMLLAEGIPTPALLAVYRSLYDVRNFNWSTMPKSFVLKPSRGFGGEGIVVVRGWDGERGRTSGDREIGIDELEATIFDILDGAHSLNNLPDAAFIEERVVVHSALKKLAAGGVPDVRVVVFNGVPVMAMLRLPTAASGGRANLHMGALGLGIDLRTGITTLGTQYGRPVAHVPDTKTKVRGIKIPHWDDILFIAARAQRNSGLGFTGVDVMLDERHGPLIVELNARPGLAIQLANGASLRTRLERIADMNVASSEHGVELAKTLFAEAALSEVPAADNVLNVVEKVTLFGEAGKKTIEAKIDTGAFRSAIDAKLVEELGLVPHEQLVRISSGSGEGWRKTVTLTFRLRGKEIETVASYIDRSHLRFPMIIGRRDLKGFLVDPDVGEEEVP